MKSFSQNQPAPAVGVWLEEDHDVGFFACRRRFDPPTQCAMSGRLVPNRALPGAD
jgi:hypothetical protein